MTVDEDEFTTGKCGEREMIQRFFAIPWCAGFKTGAKVIFAMAATLVKRQSSCCGVGKPSSSKHAKPAFRADDNNAVAFGFVSVIFISVIRF